MLNPYKLSYLIELENKYRNQFKFSDNITLLPPILKKIGIVYYLAYLVIENPIYNNFDIKRPIGVILVNKVTGLEKFYDMANFEFCLKEQDFDKVYYNSHLIENYFPSKNLEVKENLNVALDILASASSSKFFNIDNNEYQRYKNKIKKMFPNNFFLFFEEIEQNEILPINEEIEAKRNLNKIKYNLTSKKFEKQKLINNIILKKHFKRKFRKFITKYVKNEILPILKNKGTYNKLIFYYNFGAYYKEFEKNIKEKNYNCYGEEIDEITKSENIIKLLENEKNKIRKLLFLNENYDVSKIVIVDTLSKIIVIFLNALLVQEIHNAIMPNFQQEINECISLFNENINKDFNNEAKQFLFKIFNNLLNDYKSSTNENVSDLYYGYFAIHFPFDF